ncbi:MAG: iron chelate uptake ABC transporter family permease subunit [Actinomycetota bacterium]|nr:iron chelate uptake ABC transporter family permease subunit [Actinomycetota bacterium]
MKRTVKYTIILLIILIALAIVAASLGSASISLKDTAKIMASYIPGIRNVIDTSSLSPNDFAIITRIRLPRIITSILVGIALASSGVIFQGIFRNPMADPYIIGVSAGASFGATVGLLFATGIRLASISLVSIFAFGGAVGVTLLVYDISRIRGRVSVLTLLLAGVAISAMLSSINSFILMFQSQDLARVIFWLMGGLTASSWQQLTIIAPIIIVLLAAAAFFTNELNIISLGDNRATQLGVNTEQVKKLLLVLASLIAAAAVSVSGIIGFVGLITPHILRLIVGPDHKILYPTSALAGGIVLLASDTIARMVLMPREIPVGIITSIVGVPFFIYLLIRSKRQVF